MSAESRAAQPAGDAAGGADGEATGLCVLLVAFAAASVAIEASLVLPGHLLAAQIAYAVLVLVLVNIAPRDPAALSDRAAAAQSALRALALVPLIRVFALGLPARGWSQAAALLLDCGADRRRRAADGPDGRRAPPRPAEPRGCRPPHALAIAAGLLLGGVAYLAGAPALWPQGARVARHRAGARRGHVRGGRRGDRLSRHRAGHVRARARGARRDRRERGLRRDVPRRGHDGARADLRAGGLRLRPQRLAQRDARRRDHRPRAPRLGGGRSVAAGLRSGSPGRPSRAADVGPADDRESRLRHQPPTTPRGVSREPPSVRPRAPVRAPAPAPPRPSRRRRAAAGGA